MTKTTKATKAAAAKRAAAWAAIWTDARYVRIQARKDDAIKSELRAEGLYAVTGDALARYKARTARVLRALERYEATFFAARGLAV